MNLERGVYLDIETSWQRKTTVIGLFKPGEGTTQLVRERDGIFRVAAPGVPVLRHGPHAEWMGDVPVMESAPTNTTEGWPEIPASALAAFFEDGETLYTYNGACFDLPVLEAEFGLPLKKLLPHRDLLWDCRKRKLRGGLKGVERTLGIHRETEGVDGLSAMNLWAAWRGQSNVEALDLLLRYNREDCENLYHLARKIGLGTEVPALTVDTAPATEAVSVAVELENETTSTAIPVSVTAQTPETL